jgi:transcriptional regulator with XRE-family HTH domain
VADRTPRAVAECFGENLRRVRRRELLSQEQLAARASLHRTEIGLLEHGERVCRIDTLIQLSGAMGIAPGELLDAIDWVPGPEPRGTFVFGPKPNRPMQPEKTKPKEARTQEKNHPDKASQSH